MASNTQCEFVISFLEHAVLLAEDDSLEDDECETDEAETEHLTTIVSSEESLIPGFFVVAEVGNFPVGSGSDHHANVSGSHRGAGTDEEVDSGVGESWIVVFFSPGLVNTAEEHNSKGEAEDTKIGVFFGEESFSTL